MLVKFLTLALLLASADCMFWGMTPPTTATGWTKVQNLEQITLRANQSTATHRSVSVPQLICIDGCDLIQLENVTCRNLGPVNNTLAWNCSSDQLSEGNYEFAATEVTCEWYNKTGLFKANYILNGSCSLKYSLITVKYSLYSFWLLILALLIIATVVVGTCIRCPDIWVDVCVALCLRACLNVNGPVFRSYCRR